MSPRHPHLLAYSLAGALGIAYYYWKNQNRHSKRKDGDTNVLYSESEWEGLLLHYNRISTQEGVLLGGGGNHDTDCIYLDYNGTTPIYPFVLAAMLPYFTQHFGNPSSGHAYGRAPRLAIDQARRTLLTQCLKTHDQDLTAIWFTACGTEADNLAIEIALQSTQSKFSSNNNNHHKLPHVVTSNVEHPAVAVYLQALQDQQKITVTYVPVHPDGCVQADDVIAAITDDTILVTLMLANNESGALQPVSAVAQECRKRGILVHTDAAQALGKVSCALEDLGYPDMVSLVGHKVGAPKGIAALYVRPNCCEEEGRSIPHNHGIMLLGGGQEHGRRGGTENTPYIVGLATAAAAAVRDLVRTAQHMETMRSQLLEELESNLEAAGIEVRVNGPKDPLKRLPNTLSVGLKGIHSGDLLAEISDKVAASAGATCHSAAGISQVLLAMKVPKEFARGTLRLSVGPKTTSEEVTLAAKLIAEAAIEQAQTDTI